MFKQREEQEQYAVKIIYHGMKEEGSRGTIDREASILCNNAGNTECHKRIPRVAVEIGDAEVPTGTRVLNALRVHCLRATLDALWESNMQQERYNDCRSHRGTMTAEATGEP